MADPSVNIVLNAVDRASAVIGKGRSGIVGSFTELSSAIIIAEKAMQAAQQVYAQTITPTVEYAKQVRDLSTNLGISTEETSRIIQAMDDFGVEAGAVETALQMMVKRGMAPNIETLAQLADQYRSINDPVERAALMAEKLGRNWTALTPALKMGGDAIRAQAASIDKALVLTQKQVQAARDLEIAQDNLNDSVLALKISYGNEWIPKVIEVVNWLNKTIEADNDLRDAAKRSTLTNRERAEVMSAVGAGAITAEKAIELLKAAEEEETAASTEATKAELLLGDARRESITAIQGETEIETLLGDTRRESIDQLDEITGKTKHFAHVQFAAADATVIAEQAMNRLANETLSGLASRFDSAGSTIAGFFDDLKAKALGEDGLVRAVDAITSGINSGLIPAETEGKELMTEMAIQAEAIKVKSGEISFWDAAENLKNTLGITMAEAKTQLDAYIKAANFTAQAYIYINAIYKGSPELAKGLVYLQNNPDGPPDIADSNDSDYDVNGWAPEERAAGGDVQGGELYKVGERGWEYLQLPKGVDGNIIPHDQSVAMSGGGGGATNSQTGAAGTTVINYYQGDKYYTINDEGAMALALAEKDTLTADRLNASMGG